MDKKPAYNLTLDVGAVDLKQNTKGTPFLRAKVSVTVRGECKTRTLIASGAAYEAVRAVITPGAKGARVRCLFEHVEANDNGEKGEKGGEYLVAVGLPVAKAA